MANENKSVNLYINTKGASASLKELQNDAAKLRNELAKLDPTSKEFIEKSKDYTKVSEKLKDVKDSAFGVSNNTKQMVGELGKLGPAGGMVSMLSGGFSTLKGSITNVVSGFKTLTGAIAGTGIGLLLIAFTALITYFKSTEEGGDKLAKIMAVVGAIFGEVQKVVAAVGGAIFGAGEAIYDFIAGSDDAKTSTDEYSKSVTQLASEIADLQDHIGALTIDIELQNDKLQTGIESNMKALKNRNNTLEDSQKLIAEVAKDEEEKLANSNILIQAKIDLERKQFLENTENTKEKGELFDRFIGGQLKGETLLNEANGKFKEEDLRRIADILKQKEAATRESANLGEKLNNLEDAAFAKDQARRDKEAADRQKANDKRIKDAQEAAAKLDAINKNIARLEEQLLEDTLTNRIKKLNDHSATEIKLLKGNAEQVALQRKLIEAKRDADIDKAKEEQAAKDLELTKKIALEKNEIELIQAGDNTSKILQVKKDRLTIERDFQLKNTKLTEQEVQLIQLKYQKETGDLQLAFDKEFAEKEKAARFAQNDIDLINAGNNAKKILAVKRARLDLEKEYELKNKDLTEKEKELIEAKYQEASDKLTAQRNQKRRDEAAQALQAIQQGLQIIADFTKIKNDKELADAQQAKSEKVSLLDREFAEKKISQERYNKLKAVAEADADQKIRNIKTKQAEAEKRANIAQAVIAAALAVIKALPNPVTATLAGILGAAQVAKIIATPIPKFAEGGSTARALRSISGGGAVNNPIIAQVGEKGPEYVVPNYMLHNPMVANMVGMMESMRTGRSVHAFADGGATSDISFPSSSSGQSAGQDMSVFFAKMDLMIMSILKWRSTLEATISYDKIKDADDEISAIKDESKIQ